MKPPRGKARFRFARTASAGGAIFLASCSHGPRNYGSLLSVGPDERHLTDLHQLTHEGSNDQPQWSGKAAEIAFRHTDSPSADNSILQCNQIHRINFEDGAWNRVSNGLGRTSSPAYSPDTRRILYSSTFLSGESCSATPEQTATSASREALKYLPNTYQLYSSSLDGSDLFAVEPGAPRAYNSEASVCQDGTLVFVSDREGDVELYSSPLDKLGTTQEIHRLTHDLGYDGAPAWSPACHSLVWQATRPMAEDEIETYRAHLRRHEVDLSSAEIWLSDADGTHARQLTRMKARAGNPVFTPDGQAIVFSASPPDQPEDRRNLYRIRLDGTHLERITWAGGLDQNPRFSPDGKNLAFSSERGEPSPQILIAGWNGQGAPTSAVAPADPADRFRDLIARLNTADMEGRAPGTAGLGWAEDYLAQRFAEAGLTPLPAQQGTGSTGGFKQEVELAIQPSPSSGRTVIQHNVVGTLGSLESCRKEGAVLLTADLDGGVPSSGRALPARGEPGSSSESNTSGEKHEPGDPAASGVAALLEAARFIRSSALLSEAQPRPSSLASGTPRRAKFPCFFFAALTGSRSNSSGARILEEAFRKLRIRPRLRLELAASGNLEHNQVSLRSTHLSQDQRYFVRNECLDHHLKCVEPESGPSDRKDSDFDYLRLTTGPDSLDRINATGGIQIAELAASFVSEEGSPLSFPSRARKHRKARHEEADEEGGSQSSEAFLGIVPGTPGLESAGSGVPISEIQPGGAAEMAGVQQGDVLTAIATEDTDRPGEWITHPTQDWGDLRSLLDHLHSGNKVILKVRRKGTEVKAPATLGSRARGNQVAF